LIREGKIMSVLSRAAIGVFSLALVSVLIVGGHWVAGGRKHHIPVVPIRHVTRSSAVVSTMPDCKMPESPPASGPLNANRAAGMMQAGVDRDWGPEGLSAKVGPQTVIHAASGRETRSADAGSRVADASESSVPSYPQPMPLPAHSDALPLRPEGPEFPSVAEPPGSGPLGPSPGSSALGRKIIERALPNSSIEERDAWHDTLKDLAPKDVRELMRLRQELGRMPPSLFETRVPAAQPLWTPAVPGPIASEPFAPSAESPLPRSDAEREAARTIASSLDAITQGQQVLLNNVANAGTDGYKRIAVALEGVSSLSTSRHGSVGVGVRLGPAIVDMSQGKIRHTARPLDLAIEGEGFFQLEDRRTKQTFYTRCGQFAVNAQSELVWRTGQRELHVLPVVKIAVPESDVEIRPDGTVASGTLLNGDSRPGGSQRIHIVRVPALADLAPTGENLFAVRGEFSSGAASGSDALSGRVRQGCLEESNVDVERELHELERLRRQAHAMELASQSLLSVPLGLVNPPSDPTTIPSHFAGVPEHDRR
jgi:flagellar basal body rod protein FlgG